MGTVTFQSFLYFGFHVQPPNALDTKFAYLLEEFEEEIDRTGIFIVRYLTVKALVASTNQSEVLPAHYHASPFTQVLFNAREQR